MDIFYSLKEMVPKPEVQPISQNKEIKASLYQKNDKIYKLTFTLFGHLLLSLASLIGKKDHLIKWLVGDMKPVDKAVNSVASAALATTIRNPVQVSERNMPPSAKDHLLQHVRQVLPQKSENTESYDHIIDKCHEFMFTEPLDFAYVASLIHDIGEYEALYRKNPLKPLEEGLRAINRSEHIFQGQPTREVKILDGGDCLFLAIAEGLKENLMGNPSQDLRALAADNINPQDERMWDVIEEYKESRLQNIQKERENLSLVLTNCLIDFENAVKDFDEKIKEEKATQEFLRKEGIPGSENMSLISDREKEQELRLLNSLTLKKKADSEKLLEALNQEEKLLNELSAEHYIELSREPRFFGALLHIEALSKALQLNIVVKNTSNQTENIFSSQIGRPFIAILYNGRNHYDYESHRSA